MELDAAARRNLELTENLRTGEKRGSLLWVLDKTKTPMGGRMLRSWVERPLLSPVAIRRRLAAVEELLRLGEEAGALLPPRRSREEREVVERAKERLMARNGMTEEEAHRALRRRSMDRRIPLADAARMLLDEERPAP